MVRFLRTRLSMRSEVSGLVRDEGIFRTKVNTVLKVEA